MKKTIFIALITVISFQLKAQQSAAGQYSQKVAQRMKDSLGLSVGQQDQLYQINMQIASQKASVWKRYTDNNSIRVHLQAIENTRDSLYRTVITEHQMILYRQKKENLLSNN